MKIVTEGVLAGNIGMSGDVEIAGSSAVTWSAFRPVPPPQSEVDAATGFHDTLGSLVSLCLVSRI